MINPSDLNLSTLPSVPLENRSQLPSTPCIYFAIDSLGIVQYIGKTINLNQRWVNHHRHSQLSRMDSVRIAYLFSDVDLLSAIEIALIGWFQPPLNGTSVEPRSSGMVRLGLYVLDSEYQLLEEGALRNNQSVSSYILGAARRGLSSDQNRDRLIDQAILFFQQQNINVNVDERDRALTEQN